MNATPITKQAKTVLQATMLLISLFVLPISVGMVGRVLAHDQAAASFEPQWDHPLFQW
jgi:hypothetical protein